jgi:CDP-diacylglycerol--serine O-phosphatidyltransferase
MKVKLFTLPNILTLMNLACGTLAVVGMITLEAGESLRAAFILVMVSAVFDFLDGFAARLTKQYSKLGVQLDSLADMVSFGLVPTIIALRIFHLAGGEGWWGATVLVMAAFSALRLAKFNIDDSQTTEFTGLPTPANALLVGSAGWCAALYMPAQLPSCAPWIVLGCVVVLSWLLISPVRMFSLKFAEAGLRENAVKYIYIVAAVLLVIFFRAAGIGMAVVLYILASLAMWIACHSRRRKLSDSGQ